MAACKMRGINVYVKITETCNVNYDAALITKSLHTKRYKNKSESIILTK